MTEWKPEMLVTEEELLNRAILQKCWQVWCAKGKMVGHFNDLEISYETADKVLREAGIDPDTFYNEMGVQTTRPKERQ